MWKNAYLSIKKLPGSLGGPWTQAANDLLCLYDFALLCRQPSASETGYLVQILDLKMG